MAGSLAKQQLKDAVYKAMLLVRTSEQAYVDYTIWLAEFGQDNQFSLVRFVKYYSDQHGFDDSKKRILRDSLRESIFMIKKVTSKDSVEELPLVAPPPISERIEHDEQIDATESQIKTDINQTTPKEPTSQETKASAEAETFLALIKLIFKKSAQQGVDHSELITSLGLYLEASAFPSLSLASFLRWCLIQSGQGINEVVTTDEMSSIIHNLYNALCEVIGPVDADSILATSVSAILILPCAEAYSPENFL